MVISKKCIGRMDNHEIDESASSCRRVGSVAGAVQKMSVRMLFCCLLSSSGCALFYPVFFVFCGRVSGVRPG